MIIPVDEISPEALDALIESFITREGTDYGVVEVSLSTKVSQVKQQLFDKEVLIVFDPVTESVNVMSRHQYMEWSGEA